MARIIALASCLRGKTHAILDGDTEIESLTYAELTARLELRFGEGLSAQLSYLKFVSRKQNFGEDFLFELGHQTLGAFGFSRMHSRDTG